MKQKILSIFLIILMLFPTNVISKASNKASEDSANIVFFVYYTGTEEEKQNDRQYYIDKSSDLISYYNGENPRNLTNYLKTISYDKFNVKNIFPQLNNGVIEPLEVNLDIATAYSRNADSELFDKVMAAYPSIGNQIIDYNNDGYIDNITIIVKSRSGYNAVSQSTFVSHKGNYSDGGRYLNKSIGTYNIVTTESIDTNKSGVIAHEFLHTLNYPDLYTPTTNDLVFNWDIMSVASYGMPYPLAYMRSYATNWIDIDVITESTNNLRLDVQPNKDGNQAYILKSPLNDRELFVVEYRKKDTTYDNLDSSIGRSGVIVYRVNTTVEGLSNFFGKTGVYIFRPNGLSPYFAALAANAPMSGVTDRINTIGSSDMSKTLSDGALTFSDGTNSGIVIKNVSKTDGDYMTLDVEIPNIEDFDIWENTQIPYNNDSNYKNIALTKYKDKIYAMSYINNKVYTYVYDSNNWVKKGNDSNISISRIDKIIPIEYNNELYFVSNNNTSINLYKWNESSNVWSVVTSLNDTIGEIDVKVINNKLYFVGSSGLNANLYAFENNAIIKKGTYATGTIGIPKIGNINNDIYVSAKVGSKIELYKYENNTFRNLLPNINNINGYDLQTFNNNIYISYDTSDNKVYLSKYDGNSFKTINSFINARFPIMEASEEKLYILAVENNKLYAYVFNENDNSLTKEGNAIDVESSNYNTSLAVLNNNIYVGLGKNNEVLVKKKESINKLTSVTITSPTKTSYKVGESLDKSGIKVTAVYMDGTRTITNYSITGFSTSKAGTYTATISYAGYTKTFTYTVTNPQTSNPTPTNPPVVNKETLYNMAINRGYKINSSYVHGFALDTSIDSLRGKFNNVVNINSSTNIISTGTEFSYNGEKYIAVIYGDLNNDGKINSADLLKMRQHLLGTQHLEGASKEAAYITGNTNINSSNLLRLRQHLLGINPINQ